MRQIWLLGLILGPLLSACAPATALEARQAWARPALQGGNGAVYFMLYNGMEQDQELSGVTSDIAETVEVHESEMNGDVMQMHPVHGLALPAGSEVEFAPGGYHVMLVGLHQDLQAGDQFEITLHFEDHESIRVPVTVSETGF